MSATREQLRGLSIERAELYGKPHLGCEYLGKTARKYQPTQRNCILCGRPATNCHHVQPLGRGEYFNLVTPNGQWKLRSALFALCGTGTGGCHGGFHDGRFKARWEWNEPAYADDWWNGEILQWFKPHDLDLYQYGHWVITDRKTGIEWRIRK